MTEVANPSTPSDPAHVPQMLGSAEHALSIANLSHSYGARRALDKVTLSVKPATFTALLGLNGAGKSTLFSLVTRLFGVQAGAIRIFGHDIAREPGAALRCMGIVLQPRTLDLDLSVRQNLLYHAALQGIGRRKATLDAGAVRRWMGNLLTAIAAKCGIFRADKCGGLR